MRDAGRSLTRLRARLCAGRSVGRCVSTLLVGALALQTWNLAAYACSPSQMVAMEATATHAIPSSDEPSDCVEHTPAAPMSGSSDSPHRSPCGLMDMSAGCLGVLVFMPAPHLTTLTAAPPPMRVALDVLRAPLPRDLAPDVPPPRA